MKRWVVLAGLLFGAGLLLAQNGQVQVGNYSFPGAVVATASRTGQTANVAQTTLYTVPAGQGGMYTATCYAVVTTAATTSSVLPNCDLLNYVDGDTGVTITRISLTGNASTNTVGVTQLLGFPAPIYVAAGSVIPWGTQNYASVGATSMAFAVHIKLQYLGPG